MKKGEGKKRDGKKEGRKINENNNNKKLHVKMVFL